MPRPTRTELRLHRETQTHRKWNKRKLIAAVTAGLLLLGTAALADQVDADADALSTSTPHPSNVNASQQPGTTVAYDLSAHIRETGATVNKVFVNTGDQVTVSITRSGAWLATDPGSPASFTFTQYDVSQAGTIRITVPCGIAAETVQVMTATLTGTPSRGTLNPASRDLTYTITATGADDPSCATQNTAPTVAFTDGPTLVNESDATKHAYEWSFSDLDDDPIGDVTSSCGANGAKVVGSDTNDGVSGGSFECIFDDGPKTSVVSVSATDGTDSSNTAERTVTIANVDPTISSFSGSPANVLVGQNVTFTAVATDVSAADRAAGFTYSFNGGAFGANTLMTSYATCGEKTESVRAQDKDEGISASASASVNVFDGTYTEPLKPGQVNVVQRGRVIPVQITFGCNGHLSGLSPHIQLLKGDHSSDDETSSTEVTESVSKADTGQTMREVDNKYLYNLQIPKNLTPGDTYTIRARPFGSGTQPMMNIIVQIRG